MLEVARALNHAKCKAKYSIIMVAFDLEESGSQGSLVFVQDFLIPRILKKVDATEASFQGAIILGKGSKEKIILIIFGFN